MFTKRKIRVQWKNPVMGVSTVFGQNTTQTEGSVSFGDEMAGGDFRPVPRKGANLLLCF